MKEPYDHHHQTQRQDAHTKTDAELLAVLNELGTAPSGSETTVKARLDRVSPTLGSLTSWTTITITQSGSVPGTINYARYQRVGRKVECWFNLTCAGRTRL